MKSFLAALQFLTIIPVKVKSLDERTLSRGVMYFPVVGFILGLILSGIDYALHSINFNPILSSTLLVIALIVITGGMHLDGVADTADGFFSGKTRDEKLKIMRDPSTGAMGAISLISIIILKIALIYSIIPDSRAIALILMLVLSRWAMVFCMYIFPYARTDGKANVFINGMKQNTLIIATLTAIALVLFVKGMPGVILIIEIALVTALFGKWAVKKIGGITGDTLGALAELSEIAVLLIFYIIQRGVL